MIINFSDIISSALAYTSKGIVVKKSSQPLYCNKLPSFLGLSQIFITIKGHITGSYNKVIFQM